YIPELRSRNPSIRFFGERVAQNSPIEGSAADLLKQAMLGVHRRLREGGLEARLLLQVHDELLLEVHAAEVDAVSRLVVEEMQGAAALRVPLEVHVGVGPTWLRTKGGRREEAGPKAPVEPPVPPP